MLPDGAAEDEDQVGQAEGEESPEDGGVSQSGQVDAARTGIQASHPLQDFALSQHYRRRARQPGQRPVESGYRKALQHQPKYAVIHDVAGYSERERRQYIDANPYGNDAKKRIGGNHSSPVLERYAVAGNARS